jgi:glycosyltransferase involved in cell wall biosynthesis
VRLLCTITAYPPSVGGAQHHLHALLMHMRRTTPEVVTWWDRNRSDWLMGTTVRAPSHAVDERVDGIRVHRLGLAPGERLRALPPAAGYYLATGWASDRLARQIAPHLYGHVDRADVVHCVRVGREPLALASEAAARRAGRPFVFTPLHHPRWVQRRHRVYVDLYRRADRLIALTPSEREELVRLGASPDRVDVTGHGPLVADSSDADGFRSRHRIDGPMVLFLGQHFRYKGFQTLLEATPLVWRRFPDATFVFAGPPVGRSERAFRGSDPRVRRLGRVGLQEKTDALAACDVLCVPSTQESFGGVFTEAWSMGRPVVGGDLPAVRQVVDDGIDGFLVAPDPGEVAERLIWLLEHPARAAEMGEAGERKVKARWSWPALADATERIYAAVT